MYEFGGHSSRVRGSEQVLPAGVRVNPQQELGGHPWSDLGHLPAWSRLPRFRPGGLAAPPVSPSRKRRRWDADPSFQVLYALLNQSENMSGWPRVVSEDIVKQVHRLKNETFVTGGKVRGKTLLPIPEHLGSLDGTLESMER